MNALRPYYRSVEIPYTNRPFIVAILPLVLAFIFASCGGCPSPVSEQEVDDKAPVTMKAKKQSVSPRVQEFLSQFENLFQEQEEAREEDEDEAQRKARREMVRGAVNETIDELLSLDSSKEADRVEELIGDLKELGDPAREALQEMLSEKRPQREKRLLIKALGAFPAGQTAVGKLYEVVRSSEDKAVREAAVRDLGAIGGDEAQSILYELMDSDTELRPIAAEALGSMKKENITLQFGQILLDRNSDLSLRVAAVRGLGKDNGRVARKILLNVLKDTEQHRTVHKEAIAALLRSEMGNPNEVFSYVSLFESTPVEHLPQMMQPLMARGGDPVADFLNSRYQRLSRLKKIHAIRTWGRMGSDRALEILSERQAAEKDSGLKREIASAIQQNKREGDR